MSKYLIFFKSGLCPELQFVVVNIFKKAEKSGIFCEDLLGYFGIIDIMFSHPVSKLCELKVWGSFDRPTYEATVTQIYIEWTSGATPPRLHFLVDF